MFTSHLLVKETLSPIFDLVCYLVTIFVISMYLGGAMKQNRETESVFFFDKAQCASCFRATRLFVSKTRHEASNQEGQGKPLRSLTSHRRVNDLRGAPRPSWLRALCQVFDTKKSSCPETNDKHLLSQVEKNVRGKQELVEWSTDAWRLFSGI